METEVKMAQRRELERRNKKKYSISLRRMLRSWSFNF